MSFKYIVEFKTSKNVITFYIYALVVFSYTFTFFEHLNLNVNKKI